MHELSIATAVVEACAERAAGARVLRVRLEIGRLAAVMPDAIRFCFDLCAQDTAVEGAALEILDIPGRAVCASCGEATDLDTPIGRCLCGGALRIVAGEELRVKDMEIA
ncbi:MAG: hydrogenase maturation nickel metallochaperone HypA [Acidisphaera sp.]|nr:hydrogenase maturation nickel metallochaperone HypA [Acidisphaera sp.]